MNNMKNQAAHLNDVQSNMHLNEYATSDFGRQVRIQELGLAEYENRFIDKYFDANKTVLEIGTGGAYCFCDGAQGVYRYYSN